MMHYVLIGISLAVSINHSTLLSLEAVITQSAQTNECVCLLVQGKDKDGSDEEKLHVNSQVPVVQDTLKWIKIVYY